VGFLHTEIMSGEKLDRLSFAANNSDLVVVIIHRLIRKAVEDNNLGRKDDLRTISFTSFKDDS